MVSLAAFPVGRLFFTKIGRHKGTSCADGVIKDYIGIESATLPAAPTKTDPPAAARPIFAIKALSV